MKTSTSTTVIERLIDLELIFKLKADLARFKKKTESANNKQLQDKAA
jgi:hypothetical protein